MNIIHGHTRPHDISIPWICSKNIFCSIAQRTIPSLRAEWRFCGKSYIGHSRHLFQINILVNTCWSIGMKGTSCESRGFHFEAHSSWMVSLPESFWASKESRDTYLSFGILKLTDEVTLLPKITHWNIAYFHALKFNGTVQCKVEYFFLKESLKPLL